MITKTLINSTYVKINKANGEIAFHPLPIHIEFKHEEGGVIPERWYITIYQAVEGMRNYEDDNSITYSVSKEEYYRLLCFFDMLSATQIEVSDNGIM